MERTRRDGRGLRKWFSRMYIGLTLTVNNFGI